MTYQHIVIRCTRGILVIVEADFHGLDLTFVLKVPDTLIVFADMAAVTVDIGLGMADLALHLADMYGVVPDRAMLKVLVAVCTGN